jgi:glycosyltransferase involved in cell wall biosynthesis
MTDELPSAGASFPALLRAVASSPNADPGLFERLTAVTAYLERADTTARPFLSVLLRTQGRRLEPLKDALLCLSAQTDQDFEVLLLLHDAFPEDAADVRTVLERLPADLDRRLRLIEVSGGTRAKPLNVGVEAATGGYVAVYDDDDLLFANWVEAFRAVATRASGKLVRAVVANQSVSPELWPQDQDGFRTTSWPRPEYPDHFDQLQHFLVNFSPFMSWAFPRELFFVFGLRFDEELHVCEDWDVILRGSMLCGVEDVAELTSIYRRWEGGESSYSKHSTLQWRESEQRVIERINDSVMMMPPGSMAVIRRMVLHDTALQNYRFMFDGTSLRRPLNYIWDAARPGIKILVRVRNRVRRSRSSRS